MRVAVVGMWHLGTVTSAGLASAGHAVVGFDEDERTIDELCEGRLPVAEPGLAEMSAEQVKAGRLRYSSLLADVATADVVWVAYDTPVDDDDCADVDSVLQKVKDLFPHLGSGALVLISSQLPVGSTRALADAFESARPDILVRFAYSPENLRLGAALDTFLRPERVVVGVRDEVARARVAELLGPITDRIEWMSVESAEMAKHALNAFLATSIAFINEVAGICERVGADAGEVARALKSDRRIGPRAYLAPGAAFAGGTLARDLRFLAEVGAARDRPVHLVSAVAAGNAAHRGWPVRRARDLAGDLRGKKIGMLGLTYKPGTDTLRRSSSLETCRELAELGASVAAFDPAISSLPSAWAEVVSLKSRASDAIAGASLLVVGTTWPDFANLRSDDLLLLMKRPLVLDPSGFLENSLGADPRIEYCKVGRHHEIDR
jgi:UDPglucose 6-dehydrogenase